MATEKNPVSFRWSPDLIARIDAARGLSPRTQFVQQCVEKIIEGGEESISEVLRRPIRRY